MRVARERTLCIVTPGWSLGAAPIEQPTTRVQLDRLFSSSGVVHCASMFLLPAAAVDADGSGMPQLVLELAVEEGLRPADVIARLVQQDTGALWAIYGTLSSEAANASLGQKGEWLQGHLTRHTHVADGTFVGIRDRNLTQIRDEKALFDATVKALRVLPAGRAGTAENIALELARWCQSSPDFHWAADPAPRSFWRAGGASIAGKLAYFGTLIGLALAALWLLQLVTQWAASALDPDPQGLRHWVSSVGSCGLRALARVLEVTSHAFAGVIGASIRFLTAGLIVAAALIIVYGVLPALVPPWKRFLRRVSRDLDRPAPTPASRLTYVLCLLLVPVALAGVFVLLTYVFCGAETIVALWQRYAGRVTLRPDPSTEADAVRAAIGLAATYLLLFKLAPKLSRGWALRLGAAGRWFYRPSQTEVPRAMQVHLAIEQCEAALVGRTAHMISLTDLRWPYAWSAFWTKVSLRLVTFFGHIIFTEGVLGDAPGIHFGHWHLLDGGRRLLFVSNFEGHWGGYLDDFIRGAPSGTTLFWRWSKLQPRAASSPGQPAVDKPRAFPRTRLLIWCGVKCEQAFKSYARDSMLPHLYRFEAYNRKIKDIQRATQLRDALVGERTQAKDDKIMRALES